MKRKERGDEGVIAGLETRAEGRERGGTSRRRTAAAGARPRPAPRRARESPRRRRAARRERTPDSAARPPRGPGSSPPARTPAPSRRRTPRRLRAPHPGHVGKAGVGEDFGVLPHERDAPADDRELFRLVESHRHSPVRQSRFVAAHPRRATTHEYEPVWHRGGMVPPSLGPARIAVIVPVAAGEATPPGIFFERVMGAAPPVSLIAAADAHIAAETRSAFERAGATVFTVEESPRGARLARAAASCPLQQKSPSFSFSMPTRSCPSGGRRRSAARSPPERPAARPGCPSPAAARACARSRSGRTPVPRSHASRTGDQTPFVRRDVYERLGGHPPWPLLDDWDFARRLRNEGRIEILEEAVETSPRRYLSVASPARSGRTGKPSGASGGGRRRRAREGVPEVGLTSSPPRALSAVRAPRRSREGSPGRSVLDEADDDLERVRVRGVDGPRDARLRRDFLPWRFSSSFATPPTSFS